MNNYTNEIWKDIKGYEGLYQVSNLGNVKSLERLDRLGHKRKEKILKGHADKQGYLVVTLSKNGSQKTKKIHRLVLETYRPIEGMDNLQVSHLDETKDNNKLDNLTWATAKENCNMPLHKQRISEQNKNRKNPCKCITTGEVFRNLTVAAETYNIDLANLSKACHGKNKTCGKKEWCYITLDEYYDYLTAKLLEDVFLNEEEVEEEGSELVSICGQPLNDYLTMNEASVNA